MNEAPRPPRNPLEGALPTTAANGTSVAAAGNPAFACVCEMAGMFTARDVIELCIGRGVASQSSSSRLLLSAADGTSRVRPRRIDSAMDEARGSDPVVLTDVSAGAAVAAVLIRVVAGFAANATRRGSVGEAHAPPASTMAVVRTGIGFSGCATCSPGTVTFAANPMFELVSMSRERCNTGEVSFSKGAVAVEYNPRLADIGIADATRDSTDCWPPDGYNPLSAAGLAEGTDILRSKTSNRSRSAESIEAEATERRDDEAADALEEADEVRLAVCIKTIKANAN